MRVLVTGGSGRLGRSVVRVLADAGDAVVSVDVEPDPTSPAEQHIVDLTDAGSTRRVFEQCRPEAVVHLAAIAVPFSRPDAEIFATNTAILYHVLDASLAAGTGALLVASSPTVIGYGNPHGWVPCGLPIDEGHPTEPWHGYSVSKVAMEEIVAMAMRSHPRVRFGVFRPCYVITPEEWHGAPTQQGHTVRERLDDPALSAVALFNYVDARDAAEFVHAWLAADVPNGTTFFVGAADALARDPVTDLVAEHLPELAGFAEQLRPDQALFDTSRARDLLGWTPRRSWRTELGDP